MDGDMEPWKMGAHGIMEKLWGNKGRAQNRRTRKMATMSKKKKSI